MRDEIKLSTGRSFDANCGILGLAPDDDTLYHGYDGAVDGWDIRPYPAEFKAKASDLTDGERAEIARFMIQRWQRWGSVP